MNEKDPPCSNCVHTVSIEYVEICRVCGSLSELVASLLCRLLSSYSLRHTNLA